MKKLGKMGKGGMLKQAMQMFGGKMPAGLPKDPSKMDPAEMEAAMKSLGSQMPGGLGGLGGGMGLPGGLSGLGLGKKK